MTRFAGLALAAVLATAGGAADAQDAPHVISTFPPAESVVPAGVEQLTVTFDRPMAASWSFVTGGEKAFPEIGGGPSLSDDRMTISVPVRLHPNSTYVVWFNDARYKDFKDEQGRPATPYRLTFSTSE